MKLRYLCWFAISLATLSLSASVRAQDLPEFEIGLKPFGTYHGGDIDSVSITNGNLTVHLPLFSYPQRGGKLKKSLAIIYNNKGWRFVTTCNHFTGECTTRVVWSGSGVQINDPEEVTGNAISCSGAFGGKFFVSSATTDLGANHVLGDTGLGYLESIDGSGLRADANGLFHRDGTRYGVSSTVAREDPNGNQVNVDGTDSLGRLISNLGTTSDTTGCPAGQRTVTSAYVISLPSPSGTTSQIKYCNVSVPLATNFGGANTQYSGSKIMIQSVVLYNGSSWSTSQAWSFQYDSRDAGDPSTINYGDLTQMTFPAGGTLSYTWVTTNDFIQASRSVVSRTVNANDGSGPHTWTYTNLGAVGGTNIVTDPLGNETSYTVTYVGFGQSGYVTQVQYYQGSHLSGTLLKTETTDYTYITIGNLDCGTGTGSSVFNVLPIRVTSTWPGGKVSKVETDYDANSFTYKHPNPAGTGTFSGSYGQVIAERRYDYGSGAPGPLISQTINTYMAPTNSTYNTYNFVNLLASVAIRDGGGFQKAYTFFGYDEYGLYPLQSSGITTQHDLSPVNGNTRGNQTSVQRWVSTSGTYLLSSSTFFDTGTVKIAKDPKANSTTLDYSTSFVGAYPTTITNALNQATTNNYDFNTGLLTSTTDPNNQITSYAYDSLFRLTQTNLPDGGQTSFAYQDAAPPFSVTITRKITTGLNLVAKAVVDGVGRASQTQVLSDPDGTVYADTTYDAKGRKAAVSNPYRTPNDPGPTNGVTTYNYDALGRVTKVIPPDGTSSANNVATIYADNCTTVTDQAGKTRQSCTDGLGRLTQVFEPNSAGSFIYETDYQYEALNNLTLVQQKGNDPSSANWRTRTFAYDSLSRLTSATNPESGTITYAYTAADGTQCSGAPGAVCRRTDARSITTTFTYDSLNRLAGKTFSNGDPATAYTYDQTNCLGQPSCSNIGRRTSMTDAAGSEAWAYDSMGRPLKDQRATNSVTKNTAYTYNLDGSIATLSYPSSRVVTYTPGGGGRALSAVDTANSINYATAAHYAPQGALASLTNGANLYSTYVFNSRLQSCWMYTTTGTPLPWNTTNCSSTAATANILDLKYDFGLGVADNGNVNGITNNRDTSRSQTFTYDALNRIATAKTTSTSGANCWGETFSYDIWANLLTIGAVSGYTGCLQENLSVGATAQNQVSGYTYDAAGNLTVTPAPGSATYTYDAESRMKTAVGVTYTYDGDGKRVKKDNGKLYWYGMGSDVLDETDLAGNTNNTSFNEYVFFNGKRIARRDFTGNVFYYFADHLGTSRIVTSATGTVLDDSDFYPFGGERVVLSSSGNTYKFTGKERDSESGLDYFGARYYASTMGRFSSSDPKGLGLRHLLNPQKLNKYSYVLNNPLSLFDPNGMEEITITYRTFIPAQSFTYLGGNYSGDARGFSTAANASSRSSITVRLETDASKRPGNPIISVNSSAGPSQRLDANGNVTKEATATVGLPTATGTRDANGNPVINITQDTKNPLSPVPQFMTPGISANLSVTVPQDASSAQVTGTASVFPAQELNVTRVDGNTTPVLQFEPAAGATPTSLFKPDRTVDARKPTPQCSTDDKGKKVCS